MRCFFFLFCFSIYGAVAQQAPDKIFWKENNMLTWEDFLAQPDPKSAYHANTSAGLSYSWGLKSENGITSLNYEVLSYFNPNNSWVHLDSRNNDFLLGHEQLHFDITELHARKLRKKLADIKIEQLGKDPRGALNRLYENINKELEAMQQKYDRESNHSINKEAENKWRNYVQDEMKKYNNFRISKEEPQP